MKALKITARVLSTIYGALLLIIIVGEIAFPHVEPSTEAYIEGFFVIGVALLILISIILAWLKVKAGGIMLIISAVTIAILILLTAGRNHLMMIGIMAGPLLLCGVLYLLSDRK